MMRGELKQLVQLAGVFGLLAAVIGLAYGANWWMDRTFPTRHYTQFLCQDAYQHNARYETDVPYVDVPLTDGCFSGTVILPAQWKTWQVQFLGRSNPSHWMSVWYGGNPAPDDALLERQVDAGLTGGPSREMRFEGRGALRLSRLTEDPELTVKQLIAKAEQATDEPTSPEASVQSDAGYSMQLAACRRESDAIQCSGYVMNRRDAPGTVDLRDSMVKDDAGRSFSIGTKTGGIHFSKGPGETLMPGMGTHFFLRIPDRDPKVSKLHLDLQMMVQPEKRTAHFLFDDVGVQ
jgi:hypothetical protein